MCREKGFTEKRDIFLRFTQLTPRFQGQHRNLLHNRLKHIVANMIRFKQFSTTKYLKTITACDREVWMMQQYLGSRNTNDSPSTSFPLRLPTKNRFPQSNSSATLKIQIYTLPYSLQRGEVVCRSHIVPQCLQHKNGLDRGQPHYSIQLLY